jgi:hypothetical protein
LNGAGIAGSLVLLRAAASTLKGVGDKIRAFGAKRFVLVAHMVMAMAVKHRHGHHGFLVLL